jgi:hypothetical protein
VFFCFATFALFHEYLVVELWKTGVRVMETLCYSPSQKYLDRTLFQLCTKCFRNLCKIYFVPKVDIQRMESVWNSSLGALLQKFQEMLRAKLEKHTIEIFPQREITKGFIYFCKKCCINILPFPNVSGIFGLPRNFFFYVFT